MVRVHVTTPQGRNMRGIGRIDQNGLPATGLFAQYVPLLFELKIPSELLR